MIEWQGFEISNYSCSAIILVHNTFLTQLVSEFDTRASLIDALAQSCYIPLYSGFGIPREGDQWAIDGAYSDNLPMSEVGYQEPNDTSNPPIRTRYLGHVTGSQPIRDQYLWIPGNMNGILGNPPERE